MSNLQQQRNDVTHIDGNLHQNADARIGIVVGRFNGFHHCEFYVSNAKQGTNKNNQRNVDRVEHIMTVNE